MDEPVCACPRDLPELSSLTNIVIGDNESEILKMIADLPISTNR